MGDRKRKQAKMSSVAEQAERRHKEAKTKFEKFAEHTVSHAKNQALETLQATEAEKVLVHEVIKHMCGDYNRVQEVSSLVRLLLAA